jgi:hypothetical protein
LATPKANYRKIQRELESKRKFDSTKNRRVNGSESMKHVSEGRSEPLIT